MRNEPKITYPDVVKLRRQGFKMREIAEQVGVTHEHIRRINSEGQNRVKRMLESEVNSRRTLLDKALILLDQSADKGNIQDADRMMTQAAKLTGAYRAEKHDIEGDLSLPVAVNVTVLPAHDGSDTGGAMLRGSLEVNDAE